MDDHYILSKMLDNKKKIDPGEKPNISEIKNCKHEWVYQESIKKSIDDRYIKIDIYYCKFCLEQKLKEY